MDEAQVTLGRALLQTAGLPQPASAATPALQTMDTASALPLLPLLGWQPASVPVQAHNFRCYIDPATHITLDLFAYDFESHPGHVVGGWWPVVLPCEMGRLMHFTSFEVTRVEHPYGLHWAIAQPERVLAELYGPA